ncbi:signal recognition particle-docking protein FtsY [Profundibacterium mesophilum]|uniref:Signal recognition particle receptor FtsY n=1 Tax=Profundibacterium mesophilum KAUST100406-0324 TaxID=1037889 RepID=A0A921NRC5_9RHOB|nr:signal recognition particle-docking protein FtsY [Profundibacterium mesophilum]KAF0676127.1 Signal recognition particle receptor FtsY [Profundibacterium mesophilum KAUST100406-0324]
MSFFNKLKTKLFKSSSKLEDGLDAIVADGAEEEGTQEAREPASSRSGAPEPDVPEPDAPKPDAPRPDAPEPFPSPAPSPARPDDPAPQPGPRDPAPASPPPEAPQPHDPQPAGPAGAPGPLADPAAPPAPPAPQELPAGSPPLEVPRPDAPSQAPAPIELPEPPASGGGQEADVEARGEPGLLGRMFGRRSAAPRRILDDEMLEQLEELLIASDMGVETALRVTANMAEGRFGKRLSSDEIKRLLSQEIARIMEPVARPMPLYAKRPQVVLVVGVNGSGKTTTIGKLASQFRAAGKSVVIAAGDTFRAAAVEQLQVWGDRAGVPVMTAPQGSDPASLAFDAMSRAEADGADLLMIDTAGRLQNRADLMEELAKIVRVIRKKDPSAPHNTLLVLDATTGQNALNQVETFQKLADVSGLVMTKLDGTARGGVLVALADRFALPIHAIGVGEQIDDLAPFEPEEFAAALTGSVPR